MVYVDDFAEQSAVALVQRTMRASELSGYGALLAVATTSRKYAFLVPGISESQVDNLRHKQIKPALNNND
ncbi:TPM domain-containing protein [Mycobacterium lepromatosis]|uniref:TPM domain-containing protein n=1 Tax=Mycobacterium lepromatosis TaxID=480418 RepID=UPI001F244577|nr:TPM domain-containing protein [Mycobacterium lepromatosis]